jgi:hypothetical protein
MTFTFNDRTKETKIMTEFPLRRAQLVAPGGVGSIQTSPEGISGMVCGLDHWIDDRSATLDFNEFKITDEWRLSQALGIDYFVRPPDFREPWGFATDDENRNKNMRILLPGVRFPRWHFCPKCFALTRPDGSEHQGGRLKCNPCSEATEAGKKFNRYLVQVAFVAMCDGGHIQDFPFREWVHRSTSPNCGQSLKVSFSGPTLDSQRIKCDCGASRSFSGIFGGGSDAPDGKTFLSKNLDSAGNEYLCTGISPWLDQFVGAGCGKQLTGGLKGAVNIYYPYVESALYLPRDQSAVNPEVMEVIQNAAVLQGIEFLKGMLPQPFDPMLFVQKLRELPGINGRIAGYPDNELSTAVSAYLMVLENEQPVGEEALEDGGIGIKTPEYKVLLAKRTTMPTMLKLRDISVSDYERPEIVDKVSSITLVDRLRETRVLTGFGRIKPRMDLSLAQKKSMLRRSTTLDRSWLPAYEVFGEGIFLDFSTPEFKAWSHKENVQNRLAAIASSSTYSNNYPNIQDKTFLPRLVAIHTLSHVLINQLIFDCGYTAASLRERIYCSATDSPLGEMNGLLIYTASGDSEGSMGGLVRMGTPGRLDLVFEAALDKAQFCSSDPVCMELGERGQGPNSMNLAACHSCALVPETSCELFNQYLDRALLIGTPDDQTIGFFSI